MTNIEALKLALDALYPISHNSTDDPRGQAHKAIAALRQVIGEAGFTLNSPEWVPAQTRQLERFAATDRAEVEAEWIETNKALAKEIIERQWVNLNCEEVTALIREGAAGGGWQGFATRVQDAFKEKNK